MIRATLRMRVRPGRDREFVEAWGRVAAVASRQAGNLRQCLLAGGTGEFVITSDWASWEAFRAFERSSEQESLTAPLRRLRSSVEMDVAEIVAHLDTRVAFDGHGRTGADTNTSTNTSTNADTNRRRDGVPGGEPIEGNIR